MRTAEETALLVALLFQRSGLKRARVTAKTIRLLGKRKRVRNAFVELLDEYLDGYGLVMIELDRGGYGILPTSALDGAPVIQAKKFLAGELSQMRKNEELAFKKIRQELSIDSDMEADEEDL